jgi:hypothetical protein
MQVVKSAKLISPRMTSLRAEAANFPLAA